MKPAINQRSLILILVLAAVCLSVWKMGQKPKGHLPLKVGVLLPMEHEHLGNVGRGFEERLTELTQGKVKIEVLNAQGDQNLEKTMVQKLIQDEMDVLVPITTKSTRLVLSLTNHQKIFAIEAEITEKERQETASGRLAGLTNGFEPEPYLDLMSAIIPELKKITLIHATADNVFLQADELQKAAESKSIAVQKITIFNQADLYTASHAIEHDSQLVMILLDNVVASGASIIVKALEELPTPIPLLTCDVGSVRQGATLALGILGEDIGREAAESVLAILNGESLSDMSMKVFGSYRFFLNRKAPDEFAKRVEAFAATKKFEVIWIP